MNIKKIRKDNFIELRFIDFGECFIWDGEIWIKSDDSAQDFRIYKYEDGNILAVNLENGNAELFDEKEMVTELKDTEFSYEI